MPILLFLFIAMPIVEIAVFIQVGGAIGLASTLAIVVLTAIVGTLMLRHQGLQTLARARARLDRGEMPADQLVEGLFLLVGGALLLTPGFVTDTFGFLCLFPPTRAWLASRVGRGLVAQVHVAGRASGPSPHQAPPVDHSGPSAAGSPSARHDASTSRMDTSETIEGDYRRID